MSNKIKSYINHLNTNTITDLDSFKLFKIKISDKQTNTSKNFNISKNDSYNQAGNINSFFNNLYPFVKSVGNNNKSDIKILSKMIIRITNYICKSFDTSYC
jgi:hypothetical protein